MARPLSNPLTELFQKTFGTPAVPAPSRPTPALVKEIAAAWAWAPSRYRKSVLSSVLEMVGRRPECMASMLADFPVLGWNTTRDLLPVWAEWFLGTPKVVDRFTSGRPWICPDKQFPAWQAWMTHAAPQHWQLSELFGQLDMFDDTPSSPAGQRARALAHSFAGFIALHEEHSPMREAMIQDVFLPVVRSQPDPVPMGAMLAAALVPAWISDVSSGRPEPQWSTWLFEQSSSVAPNPDHRVAGKTSPSHLYGLPEHFLAYLFHRQADPKDPQAVSLNIRRAVDSGMERALRTRFSGAPGPMWLPSAQALCDKAPQQTPLGAFLGLKMASMGALVQRPVQAPPVSRRRLM